MQGLPTQHRRLWGLGCRVRTLRLWGQPEADTPRASRCNKTYVPSAIGQLLIFERNHHSTRARTAVFCIILPQALRLNAVPRPQT